MPTIQIQISAELNNKIVERMEKFNRTSKNDEIVLLIEKYFEMEEQNGTNNR